MKIAVLVVTLGFMSACATVPEGQQTATASDEGLICTESIPTGSFIKEKKCTTAAEREAARSRPSILIDARNERDSGIQ